MKHLPIGHGRLLWGLDNLARLRYLIDLEGRWSPLSGEDPCRMGILMDGKIQWADRDGEIETEYEENRQAVRSVIRLPAIGIELIVTATALHGLPGLVRRIEIISESEETRWVRLVISEGIRDTGNPLAGEAYYDPRIGGVVQHQGPRFLGWFLRGPDGEGPTGYSVWSLAESRRKGPRLSSRTLDKVGMAAGSAGSALTVDLDVPAGDGSTVYQWMLLGSSYNDLCRSHERVILDGPEQLIGDSHRYSRLWLNGLADVTTALPRGVTRLYRRSLLLLASHTSPSGAVVQGVPAQGAPELGVVRPARAALAAVALAVAGDVHTPGRIIRWLARIAEPEGYFLPRYLPDGSWAACAVPWVEGGEFRPPFLGAGTSIFLWAAERVARLTRDIELAVELPRTVVPSMVSLLLAHRDEDTGLPKPAVEPWGKTVALSTYGCAATYAGLQSAASLLSGVGEEGSAEEARRAAVLLREGLVEHLYDPQNGRFPGLATIRGGRLKADPAVDSSTVALVLFDVLAAGNPIVESTVRSVRDKLWVPGKPGGLALRDGNGKGGRREPSPLCTIWLARWTCARAKTQKQVSGALDLLRWAALVAGEGGNLPETLNPETGEHQGEMPSLWAHAELISAVGEVSRRLGRGK